MDDWYGEEKQEYDRFAPNYPMNGELYILDKKVKLMKDWRTNEQISYTPALFINGYELQKEYSVEDLKHLLG